ncbi:MAG: isochorismate synthase [Acidimicrobiia bacterium]|nr:isochorismate synthase [Acidimicrobiia bacterium]
MLLSDSVLEQLTAQLSGATDQLRVATVPVACEPLAIVRAGARLFGRSTYFRSPQGEEVASLGAASFVSAAGLDRFADLERRLARLDLPAETRLPIGFSFNPNGPRSPEWDGFGALDVVLPEATVVSDSSGARLIVAAAPGTEANAIIEVLSGLSPWDAPPHPDPGVHTVESVPASGDWQAEVAEAIGAIRDGALEKVVLARSVCVQSERATDPYDLIHHLVATNPLAYVFAAVVGEAAFVGASPELLLARHGERISANPLAGSARRGKGDDDATAGDALLASEKDGVEHAIVVNDLVSRLSELTTELDYPEVPSLRRMATVQHLSTEVSGVLRSGVSTCEVLASIHPTPAVGGMPRAEALAFIDKVEGMDRGWYSGGIGWLDPGGGAVVALALRCALLRDRTSRLYAGNGIVAGSDPAAELEETRLKFRPLLDLLAAT